MTEKIDSTNIRNLIQTQQVRPNNGDRKAAVAKADAESEIEYAALIERAMQIPQDDAARVKQAKKLLESGRLDSPANIRAAAAGILTLGV